jgi:heme/copper-type cytochrome/quinol oxidase subunit 1
LPRLSRWLIRASLLYLFVGFTLGALILVQKAVPYRATLYRLVPAHIEFLLLGWVVQLIMGVAFWILPRFGSGPRRGNVTWVWVSFMLLNAGVLAAGMGTALAAAPAIVTGGRAAELGAAIAFAVHAWPRVKAIDVRPRRQSG